MTEIMPVPRNLNFTVLSAGSMSCAFIFGFIRMIPLLSRAHTLIKILARITAAKSIEYLTATLYTN